MLEEIMSKNTKPKEQNKYPGTKKQWVSNKINPNKPIPRHIMIKMVKVKESILKTARKKQVLIKREPI